MVKRIPRPSKRWDNIVCGKHGVMLMGDPRQEWCPSCELGIGARPGASIGTKRVTDDEFRNRIEWGTMQELVPLVRAYLAKRKQGPMWIGCGSWPKEEVLPVGYNETERFFNVVGYTFGALHKFIACEDDAKKTIETLRKAGFG